MLPQHKAAKEVLLEVFLDAWAWGSLVAPFELQALGVDYDTIINLAGPVSFESVSFFEHGWFEFDEMGEVAYVMGVRDLDAETDLDVVAWSARDPSIFAAYLHQAALLGGEQVLNPASYYERPCPLWRTPLRWLQGGCRGAVVLEAIPARLITDNAPGLLVAEDDDHARELVESGAVKKTKLVVRRLRKTAA